MDVLFQVLAEFEHLNISAVVNYINVWIVTPKHVVRSLLSGVLTIQPKKKNRKFRLKVKWNSTFPENPFENCTSRGSPLFPFGTERRKFPYHLHNFPVPVSHQRKTITGNRISNGKRHRSSSVGFLTLENPLRLYNVHPTRFLPTNGRHP